jgi:hypothetical protein
MSAAPSIRVPYSKGSIERKQLIRKNSMKRPACALAQIGVHRDEESVLIEFRRWDDDEVSLDPPEVTVKMPRKAAVELAKRLIDAIAVSNQK